MAVKEWVKRFQPLSLYTMVVLTTFYFLVQLVVSYATHALTLTVDSYLMLCNLIALVGYACSIKYGGLQTITENISMINACGGNSSCNSVGDVSQGPSTSVVASEHPEKLCPIKRNNTEDAKSTCSSSVVASSAAAATVAQCTYPVSERRMKNTFGWARIDVLVMLIGCIFFSSLCFAMVIQACQTLTHITHHDEMHHPIPVLCVGAFGLVLNGVCYLLIGGFTFHQGSFLRVTSSGVVVLDNVLSSSFRERNRRQQVNNFHSRNVVTVEANSTSSQSASSSNSVGSIPLHAQRHQGPWEMSRDAIGCICVMICAIIVYLSDSSVAKYVDPIIAIISAVLLLFLSFPYMKESCFILLQTIPDHINIDSFSHQLIKTFPDIVNVHDLHVWQLTADKTISTAHIIFLNPQVYARVTKDITDFFHEQGITQVTIQPEFFKDNNSVDLISGYGMGQCLVKCNKPECYQRYCCDMINPPSPTPPQPTPAPPMPPSSSSANIQRSPLLVVPFSSNKRPASNQVQPAMVITV